MNLVFRTALQSDLEAIVQTYNSTVASRMVTADLEPVSIESKQQWFDEHNTSTRPLWIVEAEGQYVGWMSFQNFYGRPAYSGTAEISIYLSEKARGKGIGKICLQKAIDAAPSLKINSLLGFIFGHNEPSLKLFYSFGFEQWANLPKVALMDNYERDLIILGKRVL